jgi:hypothetical protein
MLVSDYWAGIELEDAERAIRTERRGPGSMEGFGDCSNRRVRLNTRCVRRGVTLFLLGDAKQFADGTDMN